MDQREKYHLRLRHAEDRLERLPELAADLVRLNVDVIVGARNTRTSRGQAATSTIPIVMTAAGDPLGSGLVTSLARPGGNVTGMSLMVPDLGGKRLELLKELFPIEASGKVELRTRRETVLADSLHYDLIEDEIHGKGNVTLRRGIDSIAGPEMFYQRDTDTGYFKEPRYYIGENGAHGDASEIRFLGPDNFEASSASYTTCVAPNRDWYLIGDEIEVDRLRSVGTARRARVFFLDVPLIASPWLEFPLTNRADCPDSSRRSPARRRSAASSSQPRITSTWLPTTTRP